MAERKRKDLLSESDFSSLHYWATQAKDIGHPEEAKNLVPYLLPHIPERFLRILVIGDIWLPEALFDEGYRCITCIDFNVDMITEARHKYSHCTGVEFYASDCTNMDIIGDKSFDVVIDKTTLDCLFCSSHTPYSAIEGLKEIYRVLKDDSILISVSHAPEVVRNPFFKRFTWSLDHFMMQDEAAPHCYLLKKGKMAK
eukprot:TRINITY_DN780246_c0_g1_i1.p1 TRINITY_DN780246_c0_g1~~TRINITY_DN780246_c0_g1_i1.p1  ORF type:complete len:198 (-),score=25.97 TRINITY_DN780246_c0_g1_i1:82-675(-)